MVSISAPFLRLFLFLISLIVPLFHKNGDNPLVDHEFYTPFRYKKQVEETIRTSTSESDRQLLTPLLNVSTAFWMDSVRSVDNSKPDDPTTFLGALRQAVETKPSPPLVYAVVYNVPNRDCSAFASTNDICCSKFENGTCDKTGSDDCKEGMDEYRHYYIDRIALSVGEYCNVVPMAFIIEPDSLPNLITNIGNPRCGRQGTVDAYKNGIIHAVENLHSACESVPLYVDAGNAGWLGSDEHAQSYVDIIHSLNIYKKIRGFSINVSNYNSLGIACPSIGICNGGHNKNDKCCHEDPCNETSKSIPGFTELNYIRVLNEKFKSKMKSFNPKYVIDTARNGVPGGGRTDCSHFCNARNAGIGIKPTTETGDENVDAFLWVKPPTESDGCTKVLPDGKLCPRFDEQCESVDSIGHLKTDPRAPEAGQLFMEQFLSLVRNGIH